MRARCAPSFASGASNPILRGARISISCSRLFKLPCRSRTTSSRRARRAAAWAAQRLRERRAEIDDKIFVMLGDSPPGMATPPRAFDPSDRDRNTVITMVSNHGDVDMVLNFVCSARRAGVTARRDAGGVRHLQHAITDRLEQADVENAVVEHVAQQRDGVQQHRGTAGAEQQRAPGAVGREGRHAVGNHAQACEDHRQYSRTLGQREW